MPALFSVAGICERALRKIGAYSINDSGADPEELQEAAYWLDLEVGEMTGTERCTWLIEDTITISLAADTASYDLSDAMGTSYPDDGVLFVIAAWATDGTTDDDMGILRRREYEDKTNKATSGKPKEIYVDRLSDSGDQKLYVYPVPADTSYSIKLVIQKHSPDLSDSKGSTAHKFNRAWQKWLTLATAAAIGSGPVRKLPLADVKDIRGERDTAFSKLQANQNREVQGPRRVKAWGT